MNTAGRAARSGRADIKMVRRLGATVRDFRNTQV